MKRFPILLAALFLAASPLAARPLAAQVAPEAIRQGQEAATSFSREFGAALAGTALPRLSSKEGGERLRALWNVDAVLAGRPQTPQDMRGLIQWSQDATVALQAYLGGQQRLSDTGSGPDYQDEIVLGLRYAIHIARNMQEGTQAALAGAPAGSAQVEATREAALARMGGGFGQIVEGGLMVVAEPVLRPANQRAIAAALAQDTPGFASMIPAERRPALARMTEEAVRKVKDEAARQHLGTVRQALLAG